MNELQTSLNELINNQRQMLNNQSTLLANVYDKSVIDDRMDKKLNIEDFNEIKDAMNLHLNHKSFEDDGYTKLPNGLIFQWGVLKGASGSTQLFPIAFPNKALCVITEANENGSNGCDLSAVFKNSVTNTGFQFSKYYTTATSSSSYTADCYYFAIGY